MAVVATLVPHAFGENATLVQDVKLQLGSGVVTVSRGTIVEVVKTEGDIAVISFRNLSGMVSLTALDRVPNSTTVLSTQRAVDSEKQSQLEFHKATAAVFASLKPVLTQAEELVIEGNLEEANQRLLGCIPATGRSAAENFVIGNLLYKADSAHSFALHRAVAQQAPAVADALLEWAMEQHRRKEYTGALRTYREYSRMQPNFAPALGLAAECAIRMGDIAEAILLYQKSEKASQGTLEQFESLVCEVNGGIYPDGERAKLIKKIQSGEESAAKTLLLLDSAWRTDWWNASAEPKRLKRDLAMIERTFMRPGVNLRAARCVAQCSLLSEDSPGIEARALMANAGFLFDSKATLPEEGAALSALLQFATGFTERAVLREKFGVRVHALAKETKGVETYNAAAYLFLGTEQLAEIDQEGWDVTHDARFAASRLVGLHAAKKLTIEDPLLKEAQKDFPDNSEIAHLAVRLAAQTQLPLEPFIIAAIKAEYTKFSTERPGVDLPRPSAYVLRGYFFALGKLHPPGALSKM